MLYTRIKEDLKESMKTKNVVKTDALRMIIGETGRLNKKLNEEISDSEVIKIIKSLIKNENIVLEYSDLTEGYGDYKSPYIKILEKYLPKELSDYDIIKIIKNNIDFTKYNSNIQAMKDIMPILSPLGVDGKRVKQIISDDLF